MSNEPVVVIVAGPAGSGKTVVGRALATALRAGFVDGDDLHPRENVEKMASGRPLDDRDRSAWLADLRALIDRRAAAGVPTVIAASALRLVHRAALGAGEPGVRLVWLDAPADVLAGRLAGRSGHFFPAILLDSQLATAEPPAGEAAVVTVDADRPVAEVVESIVTALGAD